MSLFEKFYGLEKKPDPSTPYAEMWAKAASDFARSYQEFIGVMGMVPREDYETLVREHEALKKKTADLEEALRRGKKKAGGWEMDTAEIAKGFEGLMKKQAEQFQTLVASYSKLYEAKKPEKESTKTQTPKSRTKEVKL